MVNTKIIGNKIAEARKKISISQAQLAQRLFLSAQAVGKWERGESMPDIVTLNRLADILGVDLNYFSDNVEFISTEIVPTEDLVMQSSELPSGKQKKKLSWDMSLGNWVGADFSGLKNLNEKFSSSNMQRCLFIGSDLSGLQLTGNHVDGCDFSNSDIRNSQIQGSHLVNNKFNACLLEESEFTGSYIKSCEFNSADFTGVKLKSGSFVKNKIIEATWNCTSFIGMQLDDIIFDGTIDGCYFESCAFTKVTFQNTRLINTFFKNKSLKWIRFIDCQADRMTYEFLKNGKANLSGITLLTA